MTEETAFERLISQAVEKSRAVADKDGAPNPELLRQWSNQVMTSVHRHLLDSFSVSDNDSGDAPALIDWTSTLSLAIRLREYTNAAAPKVGKSETPKAGTLDAIIDKASKTFQLPAKLIRAVIKAESNFKPDAVSPAGAKGLMQLMPGTAKEMGVADPFDAEQNVMGGSKYLKGMLDRYGGNLRMALSAYNWGPGNLEKHGADKLPSETKSYIKRIAEILKNESAD